MTRDFSTILDDFEGQPALKPGSGLALDPKRFLILRAPIIITVALVLAVPATLAAWFLTPVMYTATAQVRFAKTTTQILGEEERLGGNDYNSFVDTEIREIVGPTIVDKVLVELRDPIDNTLRNPADLSKKLVSFEGILDPTDQLDAVQDSLRAHRLSPSEWVKVSCSLPIRSEAIVLLNKVLETYIYEKRLSEKTSLPTAQLDELKAEYEEEWDKAKLRVDEKQGLLFANELPLEPEESADSKAVKLKVLDIEETIAEYEGRLEDTEQKLIRLEVLKTQAQDGNTPLIVEYGINERVNQDQRVADARSMLSKAQLDVDSISQSDKSTSARLKKAKEHLSSMQARLNRVVSEVTKETIGQLRAEADLELTYLSNRIDEIKELKDKYTLRQKEFDDEYEKRKTEYRIDKSDYARLQLELEQELRNAEEWREKVKRVQDRIYEVERKYKEPSAIGEPTAAIAPNTQNYRKKLIFVVFALGAAFFVGIVVGLVLELLDKQFRSPKDFSRITQLPVVGTIPDASEDPALEGAEHALLTGQHAGSRTADEFRRIISRVLYPEENSAEVNTLLVVSPSRGDGKTSVACNLAISLGNSNRRVLLLDANAQRPEVERLFGFDRGPGLSEVLDGVYEYEEAIRPAPYGNLFVLGPGLDALRLTNRLASREMIEFLEWADDNFDHVIIDTPAILLVSDAKLLAPTVDAVMVVIGSGTTTYGMGRRCLSDLEHLHASVIGLILNRARRLRGGYMRKNLELYYDYAAKNNDIEITELPEMEIVDSPVEFEDAVVLLPAGEEEEEEAQKD